MDVSSGRTVEEEGKSRWVAEERESFERGGVEESGDEWRLGGCCD